jgi:hypothetical protein
MAISSELGLRSGQLRDLRSLLKTQGVQLEMLSKEVDQLKSAILPAMILCAKVLFTFIQKETTKET